MIHENSSKYLVINVAQVNYLDKDFNVYNYYTFESNDRSLH